ncbi:hypothetical protein, partial [Salinivibrio sp. AR640]|uniref:hypothetical protein n=1 Tax=Salinivibrio sp. AR640 TaxID=1909437 RepID=UPI001A7EA561
TLTLPSWRMSLMETKCINGLLSSVIFNLLNVRRPLNRTENDQQIDPLFSLILINKYGITHGFQP